MVTLKDIAAELTLSRSTVSYALNPRWRSKRICPETRERILRKASQLGYRPNRAALSLKTRVTKTIGILVPTIGSEFVYEMLQGVESALGDEYALMLTVSDWEAAREVRLVQSLEERMVDGLICISSGHRELVPALNRLVREGVPVVQADHGAAGLQTDVVEPDNAGHAGLLTRYLIELGHRQIWWVRSPRVHDGTLARVAGYERTMREHGLPPRVLPEGQTRSELSRFEFAREAVRRALPQAGPPVGIACNDWGVGLGALQAVEDHGWRCPEQASLGAIGPLFDSGGKEGIPMHRFLRMRFTTVDWSIEEMGRKAAGLLLQRLQDPNRTASRPERIQIPGRLLCGDSTVRCPGATHGVVTDTSLPGAGPFAGRPDALPQTGAQP